MIDIYPNGTVVILKNANKKLMIYGRQQKRSADNCIYDYVGCFYPEGYLSSTTNVFFNTRDIEEIIHRGYCDIEEKLLVENIARKGKRYRNGDCR